MRFAIYSRKSKFTGKGESIENQIEMCNDYINVHFPDSQNEVSVYEDEGFSGKNLNRPQFQKMMKDENDKPFDFIVVYRLDRISRNVGDFASLIERLNKLNTSFICIKEQFDTSTPMGRAMMNIAAVFAQLERETIAERVEDNLYMLAKDGKWLGGTTPIGYDSVKIQIEGENKTCYRLVENKDDSQLVKLIFNKFLELRSLSKLTTYLVNHDYKTRKGSNFSVSTLRRIIINPVYCIADEYAYDYLAKRWGSNLCFTREDCTGDFGFTSYSKTNKESRELKEVENWIISIGKHKGIIDSRKWVEAQNTLEENSDKKVKFSQSHNKEALLSGILFCKCGSYMRPKYYRKNKKGNRPFAYMCELKEVSHREKCCENNLNGRLADKIVCNTLLNYQVDGNIFNDYLKQIKTHSNQDKTKEYISKINKTINEKQKQIQSYVKAIGSGSLNESTLGFVNKEVDKLNKEISELQKEIDNLNELLTDKDKQMNIFESLENCLKFFKDNFDKLSVEHKRNFIRKCIKKIVWADGELHIFIKDRRS